ncbi:DUF6302 family protein [Streptomyces sp. NPDC050732]|uniref:DUF6302 family protein n=1 Tax=Streptomyces sp. NPDC050732 TaxID=3154632 RepID=UPI00344A9D03
MPRCKASPATRHLRMRWSTCPDEGLLVEWGEEPPMLWPPTDDADVGRFYGYSKAAIDQYTARRTQVLTVPPASCSVFSPERPPA